MKTGSKNLNDPDCQRQRHEQNGDYFPPNHADLLLLTG
jgi:hypothetical protein